MVHIHAEGPAFFCWIPKLFGKRVISTIHGLDWAREKWKFGVGSKFIRQGEKNAVKYADEIIVLSKGVQKYFMETYGRETHFIPNGVNRPQIREANLITEKFGLKKDSYILFLGRLVPEKGIRYLVEAFKNVKTDKKLVIAGGSSDTDSFMVALLKSGRINNRLLCELATHKDFIKFLADIEIYVDGIATMQIQNLNALVDTVRHEIIERYRPGEDDPHLKVLQAAHISDDEYFSHMVRDDLNLIIRDIREAHKKDSESAPQTTVADELKENLEAVENFKGSRDEKLVVLYCKQLGINYKNLSDEEFRWLIRILKKSKKMGTPISQRKKR